MKNGTNLSALVTICTLVWAGGSALGQEKKTMGTPRPGVRERVAAVEKFIEARDDASLQKFVDEQFAPALRSSKTPQQWVTDLKAIRKRFSGFGGVLVSPGADSGLAIKFTDCPGEGIPLLLKVDSAPPHLITAFGIGERGAAGQKATRPPAPALTWETLNQKLKEEEANGFSGSVLVVRDGAIFLHEGYGLANRAEKIPNRADTVFAVGSTPIDFTKGAIFKLQDMGKLKMSDTIDKFLPNVPNDKKAITLDQLMTARSGLPNFLGSPEDADPDNTWIDRATALKRILGAELLFSPGSDRKHSHAAFGLLAAIVEIVSGDSYTGFLDKHLFGPAGMQNTRHYEDIRADDKDVAIGYGGTDYTPVNSPKKWEKTSWLVLGSGGMVSTTGDLHRWNRAMHEGKVLSPESARTYFAQSGGVLVGGNMHGFFTAYTTGANSSFFLCTNIIGHDRTQPLVDALANLVEGPKFRMGVILKFEGESVIVEEVESDSAAKKAGLQAGDRILTANGQALKSEAGTDLLRSQTSGGKPVELKIQRGQETKTVIVTPQKS